MVRRFLPDHRLTAPQSRVDWLPVAGRRRFGGAIRPGCLAPRAAGRLLRSCANPDIWPACRMRGKGRLRHRCFRAPVPPLVAFQCRGSQRSPRSSTPGSSKGNATVSTHNQWPVDVTSSRSRVAFNALETMDAPELQQQMNASSLRCSRRDSSDAAYLQTSPAEKLRLALYIRADVLKVMGRASYRSQIVESGTQTVHERGFATVGLREITAAAGVAQGSFTNHFNSKDEFGIAVLDHYFEKIQGVIAHTLDAEDQRPSDRLRRYFDVITDLFAEAGWRYGCLAGNMGLEAAEHSDLIRLRLREVFAEWTPPFARVIRQAQEAGEVRADLDSEQAGAALLEAWHGAILRMKIDRSPAALDRFKNLILPAVLAAPTRP